MANKSVAQFQAILDLLPDRVKAAARLAAFDQASMLARSMHFSAPRGGGALRDSIRVEQGRRPGRALVRAGGPKTTRAGFDYALANEFGTEKMRAQPFFWPTYRAKKRAMRSAIRAAVSSAIIANARGYASLKG